MSCCNDCLATNIANLIEKIPPRRIVKPIANSLYSKRDSLLLVPLYHANFRINAFAFPSFMV